MQYDSLRHKQNPAYLIKTSRQAWLMALLSGVLLSLWLGASAILAPVAAQSPATNEVSETAPAETPQAEATPTAAALPSETQVATEEPAGISDETPAPVTPTEETPIPTEETPIPTEETPIPTEEVIQSVRPLFLPVIDNQQPPENVTPETILICSNNRLEVPDNDTNGVQDLLSSLDNRLIHEMAVYLNIQHPWTGDLVVDLTHLETGMSVRLVDRPGVPASTSGCGGDNLISILDDRANQPLEGKCAASVVPAIAGTFRPMQALSALRGHFMAGTWALTVADHSEGDTGRLVSWCMEASLSPSLPTPTPPPQPASLPPSARIYDIYGYNQSMPLSCESRSAVDWARYFGVYIGEYDFFYRLPKSDDPDAGFVGSVYGTWGQIPPDPYGVHAEPVENVLQSLGLSAYAHKQLSWDDLRAEVAAGRPVEAWIVGAANLVDSAYPVFYTASNGHTSVVSRYEHTVLVIGYTPNEVVLLNGANVIYRPLDTFLDSWSILRNMAITARAEPATASLAAEASLEAGGE
jgi:subtilisin-like proprotein convertase family protein